MQRQFALGTPERRQETVYDGYSSIRVRPVCSRLDPFCAAPSFYHIEIEEWLP